MTNEKIWEIALLQSSYDCNCDPCDFLKNENVITASKTNPKARKYLSLPFECDMVSYGSNIVAQTSERVREVVREYFKKYSAEHAFETPNIYVLDKMLLPYGLKSCFMAEYFLPDLDRLVELNCNYELKILYPRDFKNLYKPEWSNALCEKRKELDKIAVGAYDKEVLVGLAGASADCEDMYQIGVDVLPEYRKRGIASALTSRLALEILRLDKVPFYCCAWCNVKSARNAVRCGFSPAWVSLTARDINFVNKMNDID